MKKNETPFKLIVLLLLMVTVSSCLDDPDEVDYTQARGDIIVSEYLEYLTGEGYDVDTTDLGVYYVILKEGEGEFVQGGDSIGIVYSGFLPESGNIFDASSYWHEDGLWKYTHLSTNLISGFYDAVGQLNEGAEGLFLIPSDLAYGAAGSGSINPYSPIAFRIDLVEIYE